MKKLNKKSLFTAIALSSVLLTSCSTAIAQLSDPDQPFAETNGLEVEGNTLKVIYDSIRENSNYYSDVKFMLNVELAKNNIGTYKLASDGTITLEEWDGKTDSEKLDFVKKHKAYWNWEDAGMKVTFEDSEKITSSNLSIYEDRVNFIKDLILKEIVSKMFSNISSSTYSKYNKYYEALYVKSLKDELETVYKVNGTDKISLDDAYAAVDALEEADFQVSSRVSDDGQYIQGVIIDGTYNVEKDYKDIISGEKQLLHLEHYVDYINRDIVPSILNNLLTEQYILENQYSSIGRTQERKIEYITISDNSQNKAYKLLKSFAANYLSGADVTIDNLDFNIAGDAWKGIYSDLEDTSKATEKTIAIDTFGEAVSDWQNTKVQLPRRSSYATEAEWRADVDKITYIDGKPALDGYSYYKDSIYGDLIKDYSTLTTNPLTNDSSNYTKFTSFDGKTKLPEEGLEIQIDSIRSDSYVKYGWGTKSDYSALPSDAREKLFSYGILSEISNAKESDRAFDWQYLKSYNGKVSFLKKDGADIYDNYDSIIWKDGSNHYIIAVYDFVSPSQVTSNNESTAEDLLEIENYARAIGYKVASGSTYTNDALEYYVENADLTYFDQGAYDFFKEQFPDLFD